MGGPRGRGPDLGKVGKNPDHTVEWITNFVRNPKEIKENARMPAMDTKRISEEDLHAAAEYLASLK
jgi:mono/diheme cytochrome c family protein